MPVFTYDALDASGRTHRGLVDADSLRAARTLLRGQGLIPLNVESGPANDNTRPWQRSLWPRRVFSRTALAVWTRQLAGLVGAGLPVERALQALQDEAEHPESQHLIAELRSEVNAGASLARALGAHPREFDASYVAVIAAGEQGGHLKGVLEQLAHDLDTRDALRHQLLAAALYPTVVLLFAGVIVMFLMTYVVPQVANAFSHSKHALPTLTVVMLALSRLLREWGWGLGLLLAAAIGALAWARRQPALRLRMDTAWLQLPWIGRLACGYNATRFATTLSMLAGAGVPILKALHTATDTLHNRALRGDALEALTLVREGAPLATALASRQRFPRLLITFARLGEQTGQLPAMLQRCAEQLGQDVQRRTLRLATLLEPLLIIAMGIAVLLIVLSVMLPIIQLNQLVK